MHCGVSVCISADSVCTYRPACVCSSGMFVCLPDGAKRRQSLSWQHVADTAAIVVAAAVCISLLLLLLLLQTNIEYSTSFIPHILPPFAYHPFISISALLRGANCTKFAQVPPKCTMKMNNYVWLHIGYWVLCKTCPLSRILSPCRLVCLIKCLRGSDKNIFLISKQKYSYNWGQHCSAVGKNL